MSTGRHLLIIATAHYSDPDEWPHLEVDAETQVWRDWLTDQELGDRAFVVAFDDLARSPSKTRVQEVLGVREGFDRHRDVLVCYITGHGERYHREHRLVLSSSLPGETSSMLPTREVFEWAMDRVETALVVVDTCYAGEVATFMSSLERDLPAGWVVIASASAHKQAHLGVLTDAVRAIAETGTDQDAQPYLDYWDLIPALADALDDQSWQPFGTPPPRSRSRLPTLPNRHYRPDVDERVTVESARRDVAMYMSDLAAHWDPRSRGVGDASTPGILFTGRDQLMRILISAAQGEPGSFVVTGVAGCGKSAVLSRLVTFSDPGFRARHADAAHAADVAGEPLPRIGDVDVAVLAKGSVAQGVLDAIRDRLGVPGVDGEAIGDTIARIHQAQEGRLITMVVDALDEAEDPRGIVNSVLSPLVNSSGAAWLRLLIGVRGIAPTTADRYQAQDALAAATIRALSAAFVDAAAPPYWTEADLAAYVARLLRTPLGGNQHATPYDTVDADQIHELARAVAKIAGTSYVLARLISDQLRGQSHPQDPTDPAWQARSRASLEEILTAELEQDYPDTDRRRVARHLLTGAALARGRGVPRRKIWPLLAQALDPTGRRYTDADIAALLDEHIGGYLIRDVADNATVYRPFHDAFAEALTSTLDPHSRRRVTAGLLDLFTVTRSHGLIVPPAVYLRRHAVEHAAESGDLGRFVQNPEVLTWSDPDHLIPLLGALDDPPAQMIGRVYRSIAHTLREPDRSPDTFVLQLRASQAGLNELAAGLARAAPHPTGRPRWATPRQDSDHQRIDIFGLNASAIGALPDGTPVVVSGGADKTVRVWRLADGAPVGEPMRGHDGQVMSVAVGALPDGTPVVVSGGADMTVRVWRLADGAPVGEPMRGHDKWVMSVAVGALPDGTLVLVSGGADMTVRVWRLDDGAPVGEPMRGHDGQVMSVAVGALPDGTPVVVSGGPDMTVRVWRLDDGAPVGEPMRGHYDWVRAVAVGALPDGTPVIVSGGADSLVVVWRLADGTPVGERMSDSLMGERSHAKWVMSVAVGALPDGTPVIVSGGADGILRVWRLVDGAPVGGPRRGHQGGVMSVAVGALPDGTPVIVSGGADMTVRVWRLAAGASIGEEMRGHDKWVMSVAVGALPDGTPVIVSGGADMTVRVWRLDDGAPVGEPMRGHHKWVRAVAVGALPDGTPVIVSGGTDRTILVRRLSDGAPVGEHRRGNYGQVNALAVGALPDGTPVIVSGGADKTVRVQRLVDGARVGGPLRGHGGGVNAVAVGALPDGTPVVVSGSGKGSVRVWRLAGVATSRNGLHRPLKAVRVWPLADARLRLTLHGHEGGVTAVAVGALPDGTPVIVSGGADWTVRVWRLVDGAPVREPLRGHDGWVTAVAVGALPDGTPVIVSGGADWTVRVWRLDDGAPVGSPLNLQSSVESIVLTDSVVVVAMDNDIVAINLGQ